MGDFTNEDTLNDVLNILKKDKSNFPDIAATIDDSREIIIPAEIDLDGEYRNLLSKISGSLNNNNKIMDEAAQLVRLVGDEKTLEAYASVAKSNAELLKTLAGAIMERDKIRTQEKMKEKDLALKKEIADKKQLSENPKGTTNIQNNFVLKSSRDEMFDMLFGKPEDKEKAAKKITPQLIVEAEIAE